MLQLYLRFPPLRGHRRRINYSNTASSSLILTRALHRGGPSRRAHYHSSQRRSPSLARTYLRSHPPQLPDRLRQRARALCQRPAATLSSRTTPSECSRQHLLCLTSTRPREPYRRCPRIVTSTQTPTEHARGRESTVSAPSLWSNARGSAPKTSTSTSTHTTPSHT